MIASTNPSFSGTQLANKQYFKEGLKNNLVDEIFKDEHNVLSVRLSGPFVLNGQIIGVVVVITDADLLVAITEDYAGLGETGEVILGKKNQAGDALFITPVRFDAGAALRRTVSKENLLNPMVLVLLGSEDIFLSGDTKDYRGELVFASTRFIESTGWGMVTKIDQAEVLKPVNDLLKFFLVLILSVMLGVIVVALVFATIIFRPIGELTVIAGILQKGDFSQRASTQSKDELGTLGRAFNTMAEKLQELYIGLEQKVKDRTVDLNTKVDELEGVTIASLNILEDLDIEKAHLTENSAQLETILNNLPVGVYVSEINTGRMIMANNLAIDMFGKGIDPKEAKENYGEPYSLIKDDGTPYPSEELPFAISVRTGEPVIGVTGISVKRMDGTIVALRMSSVLVKDKNNQPISSVVVFEDITKEKQIDDAKSGFISVTSHQLRTPLTSIRWYSEMLLSEDAGSLNPTQKDFIKEIHGGTERLYKIVNLLLGLSRVESGKMTIEKVDIDLGAFTNKIQKELASFAVDKKVTVTPYPPEGEPVHVFLDYLMLFQVVFNLLSNAILYSNEGGTVEVRWWRGDGDETVYMVRDTGIGIPKSQESRIFSKFYRADNALKKAPDGSGLGLVLVKELVEAWGGKVWFESEEGKGTTFYFTVPMG